MKSVIHAEGKFTTSLAREVAHGSPSHGSVLHVLEVALSPVTGVLTLWMLAGVLAGGIHPEHVLLSLAFFGLSFPGSSRLTMSRRSLLLDVVLRWAATFGLLWMAGLTTGYVSQFDRDLLLLWTVAVPMVDTVAWVVLRRMAPWLVGLQGDRERALVVGLNPQSALFFRNVENSPYANLQIVGFLDDRSQERLGLGSNYPVLGRFEQLVDVARQQRVSQIFISLPMTSQPRILKLLDDLKDTTASIYFLPDLFVTDLIQSKPTVLCNVPVISVCDTPFRGLDGLLKRSSDIGLSLAILLLISPLLFGIALAIKLSSPGPVIFKQRRYGQDGQEILVYKFRSMTVTEDGPNVPQAQRDDKRITPLGAILRKTSLDELPQFINVLQGRMSIVGPRPHAVAHNEMYRKLIKGYMVRHKVKPGITGWAQVNGFRGETDTLEKMEHRIQHDLDYLRNWSLKLDILIVLKTIRLVFADQKAY